MKVQFPVSTPSAGLGKSAIGAAAGKYHFRVQAFEAYSTNADGNHLLFLEIVWAEKERQDTEVGKIHRERLWSRGRSGKDDTEWSDRLANLAIAAGLMTREEHDKHVKDGTAPEFDFSTEIPGKHLVGELERRSDTAGNEYTNVSGRGFALYHVNSPESKGFPVMEGLLARDGIERNVETRSDQSFAGLV